MDSFNGLITTNEYLRSYIFWTAVLVIKMLFMSMLTGITRFRTKVNIYLSHICIYLFCC